MRRAPIPGTSLAASLLDFAGQSSAGFGAMKAPTRGRGRATSPRLRLRTSLDGPPDVGFEFALQLV